MNRPPKGDEYRRGNYAMLMFQPSANDTPDMTINIKQGSFWINNSQFIEYTGGTSPVITAPASGAKWVLVALNKAGKIVISNGAPSNNNPPVPNVAQNVLPIAFIYVKSSTKVITNDMIYDARPIYAAGGYPINHSDLQNRNKDNSHSISAITGLQDELDNKLSQSEAESLIALKADMDGTNSASFTLNAEDTGTPVEHCGIYVNRGSMPKVGIKYDEDLDKWCYTNDGSTWNVFDNDPEAHLASSTSLGNVYLSEEPNGTPIAVGINDPLFLSITDKISRDELNNKYVTKDELENRLDMKLDVDYAYSKSDANNIFVTKSELDSKILNTYTREQIDSFLNVKANVSQVYTKTETDLILNNYYTKEEINNEFAQVDWEYIKNLDLSDYYKKYEVDALLQNVTTSTYTKDYIDSQLNTKADYNTIHAEIDQKIDKTDAYTKGEIDNKFDSALTNSKDLFYQKNEVDAKLDQRALVNHNHSSAEIIEDSVHRFVSESQINTWDAKQDALGFIPENTANKGLANGYVPLDNNGKIPEQFLPDGVLEDKEITTISTYEDLMAIPYMNLKDGQEYFVQDASGDPRVKSGSATYVYNNNGFQLESSTNHTATLDWEDITNKPDLNKYIEKDLVYTKDETYSQTEINNLLDAKTGTDNVYTKNEVYNINEVNNLLNSKANISDVYNRSEIDDLLDIKINVNDVYTKSEVYNINEANNLLNSKANASDVYNKTEIDDLLDAKINTNNVYTKDEVYNIEETNNLLNSKADTGNVYNKTEVNDLLDTKVSAGNVYTKNEVYNKSEVNDLLENSKQELQEFTDPTGNCKYYAYSEDALVFTKAGNIVRIIKNGFVHSATFHFEAEDVDSTSRVKIDYDDTNLPANFMTYNLANVSFIQVMGSQGATKVSNNVFYTDMSNPHYCECAVPFGNQGPVIVKIVY